MSHASDGARERREVVCTSAVGRGRGGQGATPAPAADGTEARGGRPDRRAALRKATSDSRRPSAAALPLVAKVRHRTAVPIEMSPRGLLFVFAPLPLGDSRR